MGERRVRDGAMVMAVAVGVMAAGCLWHVAPAAAGGTVAATIALGLVRLVRRQRRVDERLSVAVARKLCGMDVLVVPGAVGACTVGPLRPTIVLGGATVAILDADELRAVVHHERAHQVRRDPLWDALAVGLDSRRVVSREIRADAAALRAGVPRAALASALLKVPSAARGVGFTPASEQRVRALLGDAEAGRAVPILLPLLGTALGAIGCMWTGHHLVMALL